MQRWRDVGISDRNFQLCHKHQPLLKSLSKFHTLLKHTFIHHKILNDIFKSNLFQTRKKIISTLKCHQQQNNTTNDSNWVQSYIIKFYFHQSRCLRKCISVSSKNSFLKKMKFKKVWKCEWKFSILKI